MAQPIQLTDAQVAALAAAAGIDSADLAAAVHQTNRGFPPDAPGRQLNRADVEQLFREGKHAEISKARVEGRIDYTPKDAA